MVAGRCVVASSGEVLSEVFMRVVVSDGVIARSEKEEIVELALDMLDPVLSVSDIQQ